MALGLALGFTNFGFTNPAQPAAANSTNPQACVLTAQEITRKSDLLREAAEGDRKARQQYDQLLKAHSDKLAKCRRDNWPQNQALWLRLYPCDLKPGVLEQVLDQVVNQGYNQVYVESFYSGRTLLPLQDNDTAWPSVVTSRDHSDADLLAQAIKQGRERGLKVYAWMYSMNFGASYAAGRGSVLARNGKGQTSLELVADGPQAFVDPYNREALRDYNKLVRKIAARRPDGILFDYIRYPRGSGTASVADNVKDLLIYSPASREALISRARNNQGQELISRFMDRGYVRPDDIQQVMKKYPQEDQPMWQGRIPAKWDNKTSIKQRQEQLQQELWLLSVAHAYQGVVDFLNLAIQPALELGLPAGAVFFPGGNQTVGRQGFDSRLQPWERFAPQLEWHPMSYAACGTTSCILDEVKQVLQQSPAGGRVQPALAGTWGSSYGNRPSLEAQMVALGSLSSRINTVSHFAYSWQQPQNDANRKACRL
ncbi:MAG: hypothetical protein HC824_02085 [Synechococcales cyanobacterium RM1_1_8]|nr:hypothetical protein [Synechococcales cyanobacterium RM1_1_8]